MGKSNMKNRFVFLILGMAILAAVFLQQGVNPAFAADKAGEVTAALPKSWAVRDGRQAVLNVKSDVQVKDTLKTDAKGKLEVRLNDGTVVALGPSSDATVSEFIMTDTKNSFKASIAKGAARVVTGDLVKRNPNGFKITTPRSTVGIRGTEVVFVVQGGNEIFSVTNIGAGSYVSVVDNMNGNRHRLDDPGQSLISPRNTPARVVKNSAAMQRLINTISQGINSGNMQDIEKNVMDVISEANKVDGGGSQSRGGQGGAQPEKKNNGPLGMESSSPGSMNDKRGDPGRTEKSTSPKPIERCN